MFDDIKKLAEALPHVLELLERATCALEKIAETSQPTCSALYADGSRCVYPRGHDGPHWNGKEG